MEIRKDLLAVENLLQRLVQYATAFRKNNYDTWPHYKNNEDFDRIYSLERSETLTFETIYSTGRDLAVFMGSQLVAFNFPEDFPTLKKFIDSFDGGWLCQSETDSLKLKLQNAKDAYEVLSSKPWSVGQMLQLFESQISLLEDVNQTFEALRASDIYKFESGHSQSTIPAPDYKKILHCVHSIGKMFERLPSTYADKDEEALRDHILVSLQAIVEGSATGETFNKRGKTDILVRNGDTNEFVGECKFWSGQSNYIDTISQLLGYLSWRDTKTAVVIFVKNVDFSAVLDQVDKNTAQHPQHVRTLPITDETWHNFEFRLSGDNARIISVAAMFYHTPPV